MTGPHETHARGPGWRDALARGNGHARVLVVDDNPDIRRSLQRMVTSMGHTVRQAGSAEEADQWMAMERFESCLLDIELPRMSGVEFLDWALSRDPTLAVIMLTGLDAPELAIQCIDRGARTYLVKPIDPEFLRLALRDALAMRRLLRAASDTPTP